MLISKMVKGRPDPLLHAGGDGEAVVGVEGREPAQPDNSNPQWTRLNTTAAVHLQDVHYNS